ncbi:hypothetical protein AAHB64_01990 [Bacillus toyonensis]
MQKHGGKREGAGRPSLGITKKFPLLYQKNPGNVLKIAKNPIHSFSGM